MPVQPKRTQEERREATRYALLQVATRIFGDNGYSQTSVDDIVKEANLTKGALYHHFKNKLALFEAVNHELEQELIAMITEQQDQGADLQTVINLFLDRCVDTQFRQIVLLDSPVVLGLQRWHDTEERLGSGILLHDFIGKPIKPEAVVQAKVITNMFIGGLIEAAKMIASSEQPEHMRQQVGAVVSTLTQLVSHAVAVHMNTEQS